MRIAIFGEAGCGKDYITNILIRYYGFDRYAFADGVRELAAEYFPNRYDINKKDRKLLQDIGTKMREIDTEIWINRMINKIHASEKESRKHSFANEMISVTDCRLPNEYQALKNEGFVFVRVLADTETRRVRMEARGDTFIESDMEHATESHYNEFECDFVIDNNQYSTNLSLMEQLDDILQKIAEAK